MSKADPASSKKERNKSVSWIVIVFITTIIVSAFITWISNELMQGSSVYVAFAILLVIVFVGIVFDVIGVAVTSADEKPFHSMAARKVHGAQEAIRLLRNAEKVSSICNDVIGDICGVVSGSASAAIAAQVLMKFSFSWPMVVNLMMSALVAGLTVGGKAMGKSFAINSSTKIVQSVGGVIAWFGRIPSIFKHKEK